MQSLLDKGFAPATRWRKVSCLRDFYKFLAGNYDLPLNLMILNYKIESRHLLTKISNHIDFPGEKIQRVLAWTRKQKPQPQDLQMLRDLALVWSLAETGLRVSEACRLQVGDIDRHWRATFVGKGNKQATVKFAKYSREWIGEYLKHRAGLDQADGRERATLPLFARHDTTAGQPDSTPGLAKVKPLDPDAAQKIIHNIVWMALGDDYDSNITAHKFRHYFVSRILDKTNNLKKAQEMARHENIGTTARYAHLGSNALDEISQEVFG